MNMHTMVWALLSRKAGRSLRTVSLHVHVQGVFVLCCCELPRFRRFHTRTCDVMHMHHVNITRDNKYFPNATQACSVIPYVGAVS